MSMNDTNPKAFFGGEWNKIEGRFLLGSSDGYRLGARGGSANAVVVSHDGHVNNGVEGQPLTETGETTYYIPQAAANATGMMAAYGRQRQFIYNKGNEVSIWTTSKGESGVGKNMPPYLVVNIWQRVA